MEIFMNFLKNRRRVLLFGIDAMLFVAVYAFALLVSVFSSPSGSLKLDEWGYVLNCAIFFVCIFTARIILRTYSNVWRYANALVFLKTVAADAAGGVCAVLITHFIPFANIGLWMGSAFVCMANVITLTSRFAYQYKYRYQNAAVNKAENGKISVAIVGAGQIGTLLAEELIFDKTSKYKPLCFIDRNKDKVGSTVTGLRVYSPEDAVRDKIKKLGIEEILVAISNIDEERVKAFFEFYSRTGCKVKIYDFPIKSDGADDKNSKRVVRDVRIEDLLFRDTLNIVNEETEAFYKDKVVLVTGGGGSIGSELARQVAKCSPRKLIIFDIYENNAYDIEQELKRKYGGALDLTVEIGSVRDRARLEAVFSHYRPEVVFHAAAHKHVPLMEHSNSEAVKNNVFGTYNTADMAEKYGTKKFILISTDKAVNPTNVMGASKRLCEMVVQCRRDSETVFAAVRFGNVLGSNGSVIPLFKNQIMNGGPVTITDKRIIRYFMTIPEASGLVMQAGAMAKLGELFVLDMGKPVKILELAENMIKLSGLNPYIDIDIVETGLRPGEKLYEELLIKTEKLTKTKNNLIFIERDAPLSREEVDEKLRVLREAVESAKDELASEGIVRAMKSVVPTFYTPDEINGRASDAKEMQLVN